MDLQFDTEQLLLRDSAESFLGDRFDYRTVLATSDGAAGWDPETWREFAKLGWLGLPFPEDDGGSGLGPVELAILMEAFGKYLVPEPYVPTVVLCGHLVDRLAGGDERARRLSQIIEGKLLLALAHDDDGETTARQTGSGFTLDGAKKNVLAAPMAEVLLVSARTEGGRLGLFAVPKDATGLHLRAYKTVDGRRAADVTLDGVAVPEEARFGGNSDVGALIDESTDRAIAAFAAEAVGAIAALVEATVEYTKTRVQFGQPIARFQALQHRMVAMKVKEEEARASSLFATLSLDGDQAVRRRAVHGAKAKIGRCGRSVYQEAIQLHGAIGTTNELPVGAFAKRILAFETMFGTTREHLSRYGQAIRRPEVSALGLLSDSGV